MSITAYKLARAAASDTNGLAEIVNTAVADGWQPFAPIYESGGYVYQVLVQGTPDSGSGSGGDYTLPAATPDDLGGVKQAAFVDGESGTLADLTAALIAAGIMAAE